MCYVLLGVGMNFPSLVESKNCRNTAGQRPVCKARLGLILRSFQEMLKNLEFLGPVGSCPHARLTWEAPGGLPNHGLLAFPMSFSLSAPQAVPELQAQPCPSKIQMLKS